MSLGKGSIFSFVIFLSIVQLALADEIQASDSKFRAWMAPGIGFFKPKDLEANYNSNVLFKPPYSFGNSFGVTSAFEYALISDFRVGMHLDYFSYKLHIEL